MILKIDLTEEQLSYIESGVLEQSTIEKMIDRLIPKLVQDNKVDYGKNMVLVAQLTEYMKERKETI